MNSSPDPEFVMRPDAEGIVLETRGGSEDGRVQRLHPVGVSLQTTDREYVVGSLRIEALDDEVHLRIQIEDTWVVLDPFFVGILSAWLGDCVDRSEHDDGEGE